MTIAHDKPMLGDTESSDGSKRKSNSFLNILDKPDNFKKLNYHSVLRDIEEINPEAYHLFNMLDNDKLDFYDHGLSKDESEVHEPVDLPGNGLYYGNDHTIIQMVDSSKFGISEDEVKSEDSFDIEGEQIHKENVKETDISDGEYRNTVDKRLDDTPNQVVMKKFKDNKMVHVKDKTTPNKVIDGERGSSYQSKPAQPGTDKNNKVTEPKLQGLPHDQYDLRGNTTTRTSLGCNKTFRSNTPGLKFICQEAPKSTQEMTLERATEDLQQ